MNNHSHVCCEYRGEVAAARSRFNANNRSRICSSVRVCAPGFNLFADAVVLGIRADNTAIPWPRPQSSATTGTHMKNQSVIGRNIYRFNMAAHRASQIRSCHEVRVHGAIYLPAARSSFNANNLMLYEIRLVPYQFPTRRGRLVRLRFLSQMLPDYGPQFRRNYPDRP